MDKKTKRARTKILLSTILLSAIASQSIVGVTAEASAVENIEEQVELEYNYDGAIQPYSVPSQGGTGGGAYSQEFHQYGSSSSANSARGHIYGFFVGAGLSWVPGLNSYAAYFAGGVITYALSTRPVVYYKISTYITKTTSGRQVRTTVTTYSDRYYSNVIRRSTKLAYEYN